MRKFSAALYLFATLLASGLVLGQDEISVSMEDFVFQTERLKELEKLEDELQSTIAGLKAEIDEKDRQIDEIQALSSKIEALQTENGKLEQDIETREARITELQSENSDLNKEIAHIKETWIPKPRPNPEPRTGPAPQPDPEPPRVSPEPTTSPPPPPVVKPSPPPFQRLATSVEGYQFNRSGQKLPDQSTRIFQINVTISDPISQREYRKFCRQSRAVQCPSGISDSGDPVTGISWNEANAYMRWLSRHTRQSYRFPWYQEIAARPTLGNEWSSQYGASAQVVSTSGQPADATLVPLGQRRAGTGFRLAIR